MNLFENPDIETLFKVEMPITPVKVGHGYMGVILRNKKTDKLQCHICGEWYESLISHIGNMHKLKGREYKIKYGLPLGFALCNRKISEKLSATAIKNKNWMKNKLTHKELSDRGYIVKKNNGAFAYMRNNDAFHNILGICDEQIDKRFLIVADIIGKSPSQSDLVKYDNALFCIIKRRFGNINKYRKIKGYALRERYKSFSNLELISALRKFFQQNKRLPAMRDFTGKHPSAITYRKRFGSWRKALSMAGLMKGASDVS